MTNKLKKSDLILVDDKKYLVYKSTKTRIELLPIDRLLLGEEISVIPKLYMTPDSLDSYQILDSKELLYLLDQENVLVKETLRYLLYEK